VDEKNWQDAEKIYASYSCSFGLFGLSGFLPVWD